MRLQRIGNPSVHDFSYLLFSYSRRATWTTFLGLRIPTSPCLSSYGIARMCVPLFLVSSLSPTMPYSLLPIPPSGLENIRQQRPYPSQSDTPPSSPPQAVPLQHKIRPSISNTHEPHFFHAQTNKEPLPQSSPDAHPICLHVLTRAIAILCVVYFCN